MAVTRRLIAILAADVVGYSRLMDEDEEGIHERLKAHLAQLVVPKIREYRGRAVKNTGDGLLAEFASVVDAVRCAVEVQRGMFDREARISDERRVKFRIGINLGDVIVEEHDIFGDGVNIAARLEALAEPGGICISRTVREQIRNKLPYPFEDCGERTVKNIPRPVRIYALRPETVADLPAATATIPPRQARRTLAALMASGFIAGATVGIAWWTKPPVKLFPARMTVEPVNAPAVQPVLVAPPMSIVVLPFTNLSNDSDQQYFADGIVEDLTTDLSQIEDMLVISRNTAFTYRSKQVNARQIGRDLGVRYLLEGSVQRSGNQARVNVQLIDAESDTHLWADRFDRDLSDLLALQDEITSRIAMALNRKLIAVEATRPIEHPDAIDYIFRGRAARLKPNSPNVYAEAIGLYERALVLDPGSVEAKTRLAEVLADRLLDGMSNSPARDMRRAEELIEQALAAAPSSPLAHFAKGELLRAQRRFKEAIPEFETVLASDRNSAWALFALAHCKLHTGAVEEVIPLVERSIRLSPRDPNIALMYFRVGEVHLLRSQADEAVSWFEKARSANPNYPWIRTFLASAYGLAGKSSLAVAEIAEARRLNGSGSPSSISQERATTVASMSPAIWTLFENTYLVGLRRAGLPDE